jgi:hypothetical protein
MLRGALASTLPSGHSRGSASDFGCLVGFPGRDNIEGPTVQELASIRRSLLIKFLAIGKLANNRPWVLGRCGPTNLYCPSIFLIVGRRSDRNN